MSQIERLRARRKEVLAELAGLERIRRGSVMEQYVEAAHRDGSRVRRGPYPLYTYKERGKTVSRRLRSAADVERCRQEIAGFRRFRRLVEELLQLGEKLSALAALAPSPEASAAEAAKKTTRAASRRTQRSRAS